MVFFDWRGAFFALTSAMLLSASAAAQNATFPEEGKDITFICISAAGGPTDAATRVLAESVSKALGKQIIVDVKAGANGAIGLGALVRSEPDGHTLAIGGYSVATTTWLRPDSQVTFDGDDFEPIATFMSDPVILAVPASSPYQNLADFVAAAKAKPKAIRAGTTGYLGTSAFVGMLLEDAAGISLTLVPFTGSAGTVAALAGNQIEAGFVTTTPALPLVQSGQLRILAYFDDSKELEAFPGLKSAIDQGFDVNYPVVTGLFAPAGTPPEVLQFWSDQVGRAMEDKEFVTKLSHVGTPVFQDLGKIRSFWKTMQENTRNLVALAEKRPKD